MGWRPTTIRDVIVVALVRHGPLSISKLAETINERYFEEWQAAHGRWPQAHHGWRWEVEPSEDSEGVKKWGTINKPSRVGYTDLYSRLQGLQGGVVFQDGKSTAPVNGRSGAYLWRAVTSQELADRKEEKRERLVVPDELRERVEARAKEIGCEVEFARDKAVDQGWLVLVTARGRVEVEGPPDQSWYDAAIEVGLL